MVWSERLLPDRDGALDHGLRFGIAVFGGVDLGEVVESGGYRGMVRPQTFLPYRTGSPVHGRRVIQPAFQTKKLRGVIQAGCHVGMLRSQRFLFDSECATVKRFRIRETLFPPIK